jgi:phage baseplate assembly protein W
MNGPGEGRLLGQGISFPPRIGVDGRVAWSSGADSIRESIRVVLMTDPGERLMLPAFGAGLRGFLFEPNIPATHRLIQERVDFTLGRWEPRIDVVRVAVDADPDDAQQANVTIDYTLVATEERGQVGLAVRLAG